MLHDDLLYPHEASRVSATVACIIVDMFPTRVRFSGVAITLTVHDRVRDHGVSRHVLPEDVEWKNWPLLDEIDIKNTCRLILSASSVYDGTMKPIDRQITDRRPLI
jgi:hypothetical protein